MVGAVGAAAGAVQRTGRSAGDHLRAAGAGPSRFQAAQTAERSTLEKQALQETASTKTPTGESNASVVYWIGCGGRRHGRGARFFVRLHPLRRARLCLAR